VGSSLDRSLQSALAVDEYVRAHRSVAPAGELGGQLTHGLGGGLGHGVGVLGEVVGVVAGTAAAEPARRPQQVVPSKANLLVVTSQRVLLGRTSIGRYRETLAERPIGDVARIEVQRAKVAFGKLRLHFIDGGSVELDLRSDRGLDGFVREVEVAVPVDRT
jgi:hypothetical protein